MKALQKELERFAKTRKQKRITLAYTQVTRSSPWTFSWKGVQLGGHLPL